MIALLLTLALGAEVPNHALTPGATRPLTRDQVCSIKWGTDRRHVTVAMKKHVAAAYGVPWTADVGKKFEFDHLVPRELAGADVVENLSPQEWQYAHLKDRLENELHRRVCAGEMTLDFAQSAIITNWKAAYRLYIEARR
jgi:hypothetical protein